MTKIKTSDKSLTALILSIVLGYFVYGDIGGALGMGLLFICMGVVTILSVIPVIGWTLSLYINEFLVIPKVLSFTGLHDTWLVTGISYYWYIFVIIISVIVHVAIATLLINRN